MENTLNSAGVASRSGTSTEVAGDTSSNTYAKHMMASMRCYGFEMSTSLVKSNNKRNKAGIAY